MASDPAVSECAQRLQAAVTALARQLRQGADRGGPGPLRLSVLGQLHRAGPLAPSELARREQVRLQSLTRLLAELEAEGCVLRSPHPSDARQSLLSITAAGRRGLADAVRAREQRLAGALAAEAPDAGGLRRLQEAAVLMERLAAQLGAAAAEPVQAGHPGR